MNKKVKKAQLNSSSSKSTYDDHVDSLSPKRKKEFDAGLKELALSELIFAIMEHDEISVRKLAKMADLSPTVVQAMRSGIKKDFTMQSFFKILKGLGCKKLIIEFKGQAIPLELSHLHNK